MKTLLLLWLFMTLSSCESFRINGDGKEDESISGTVTQVWSQLAIGSAYAATPEAELISQSASILKTDFFNGADKSDYDGAVTSGLASLRSLLSSTGSLISSNFSALSSADFEHGIGISIGFNSSKKIVSVTLSKVSATGKYSFKDAVPEKVSFYKIVFLLNKPAAAEFRLSYVERTGRKINEDINFATTSASVKVTRELSLNTNLPIEQIRTKIVSYKSEIDAQSITEEEHEKIWAVAAAIHEGVDSSNLHESAFLTGSFYLAICTDQSLRLAVIEKYDEWVQVAFVTRPQPSLKSYVSSGPDGAFIMEELGSIIDELVTTGFIPPTEEDQDNGGDREIIML